MACPKCNSANVRVAEPGFAQNTMFCMKCGQAFKRMAPAIKAVGAHGLMFALPSIAIALLSDGDTDI